MDTKIFETAQSNSDFKPHENDLDVGLDLKFVELHIANGEIEGKLALSTDDYPLDLPISGSSTTLFRVNTNCGYFYFFSEAKLNFGYKFNGMVFIAHELFQNLDHTIGGYNSPLEEVSRNIYLSKEDFLVLIDKPEQGNLLTGFMGTGGVGIDVLGFDVTLKGGFFCFNIHRFENGSNRDKLGVVNAIMATVDLPGAEAAVSATISASASFSNPQLDLRGKLCFCGCLEADVPLIGSLGYLLANASVGCWLSTEDGFGFDEIGFGADAGFGDCPCDEDPCP